MSVAGILKVFCQNDFKITKNLPWLEKCSIAPGRKISDEFLEENKPFSLQ